MPIRWIMLLCLAATAAQARIVGTNPPARPLTAARIATLPAPQQAAWREYLARSEALRAHDREVLAGEVSAQHLDGPVIPRESRGFGRRWLERDAAWYGSAEARKMADNIVSFQTPAGGWGKNFNPADHHRAPGEAFVADNVSRYLAPGDYDLPADPHWNYVGTFDNDATIPELRFLARVAAAADENTGATYRAAVRRGVAYILNAQYPNGGWPQVFPLEGGYHDAITFNDDAVLNNIELLRAIAAPERDFAWLTATERQQAAQAADRGLACVLNCQLVLNGERAGWAQQYEPLGLKPESGRNYEMPSLSTGESADIVAYLMTLPEPSADTVAAVYGASAWFRRAALHDVAFRAAPDGSGRAVVPAPGALLWARYYDGTTSQPLFGDRDKSIHDRVEELSRERRNGYAWYGVAPARALAAFPSWAQSHPAAPAAQ